MHSNRITNDLTKEDIQTSTQYKWLSSQIKFYLILWGAILVVALVVGLFVGISQASARDIDYPLLPVLISVGVLTVLYGVIFLPFIVVAAVKRKRLLNNYASLPLYEVALDNPHTSYWYRYSVYFSVVLADCDTSVTADTCPMFSSSPFSTVALENYSNKKVRVLYDCDNSKVYVIDLV